MSVLRVFGENLRLLCKTRPSIASVCRDLDINRVQFNRYMSGHSFPKPNVLQQICDYFLVNSRIYLEPLTPDDLERVERGQSQSVVQAQRSYLHQAVDYFERGIALTVSQSELPDGIHCFWRRSFSELETASCNLISIKTVEGVRVFKSLELLKSQRNRAEISGRSTPSSRGVVMRCPMVLRFLRSIRIPLDLSVYCILEMFISAKICLADLWFLPAKNISRGAGSRRNNHNCEGNHK